MAEIKETTRTLRVSAEHNGTVIGLDVFVNTVQKTFDIQDLHEEAVMFTDIEKSKIKLELIEEILKYLENLFNTV